MSLLENKRYIIEYIWIDESIRSQTKIIKKKPLSINDIPNINIEKNNIELILKPCKIFKDPFRLEDNILVLCDCYNIDNTPYITNTRILAKKIFKKNVNDDPLFKLEQEYVIFNKENNQPIGWPSNGYPNKQGQYYCGIGNKNAFGRKIAEAHYKACLYAGINITGINAEVMPGQWKYKIGICDGIISSDHLWISRYILERISEDYNIYISFDPKPIKGDWNGSGCHIKYSTNNMRIFNEDNSYNNIINAINKLKLNHNEHIKVYGINNENRLLGKLNTSKYNKFTYDINNKSASVCIPYKTYNNKCGYFEDRRPGSNIDPYIVTSKIFETTCLKKK